MTYIVSSHTFSPMPNATSCPTLHALGSMPLYRMSCPTFHNRSPCLSFPFFPLLSSKQVQASTSKQSAQHSTRKHPSKQPKHTPPRTLLHMHTSPLTTHHSLTHSLTPMIHANFPFVPCPALSLRPLSHPPFSLIDVASSFPLLSFPLSPRLPTPLYRIIFPLPDSQSLPPCFTR